MNDDEIRRALARAIGKVAPEADLASLEPSSDLREALDLDSMDFLNVVVQLHAVLGVEIPERDYAQLHTWGGAIAYLREHQRNKP